MSELDLMNLKVRVLGLGGAGSLIVDTFCNQASANVECYALDSDSKFLGSMKSAKTMLVGQEVCRGIGCGGDIELAQQAIEQDRDLLNQILEGRDVLILVAGLGGGIGSALASVISELSGKTNALILGFFILPFSFEGSRYRISNTTAEHIRPLVHGMFTIQNDLLLQEGEGNQSALNVFENGNRWILNSLNSIQNVLFENGLLNQDLGSLKKVFSQLGGKSFFAVSGEKEEFISDMESVQTFIQAFLSGPFFHLDIRPSHLDKLLIIIKGSQNLELSVINDISSLIIKELNFKKDVNLGAFIDPSLVNTLEICIFGKSEVEEKQLEAKSSNRSAKEDASSSSLDLGLEMSEQKPKVHKSKLGKKHKEESDSQKEFQFFDNGENRGYFENTDTEFYKEINLDMPTYLRKGIKVKYK